MESFLAQKKDLKDTAQRAFIAYIKSVVLMKNKKVFQVDALNLDAFARSFGLVITPRVRFLDRLNKKKKVKGAASKTEFNFEVDGTTRTTTTSAPAALPNISNGVNKVTKFDSDDDEEENEEEGGGDDKGVAQNKKDGGDSSEEEETDSNSDTEDDDDFMTVKRKDHTIEEEDENSDGPDEESILYQPQSRKKLQAKPLTKASLAKKVLKKKIVANKKIQFDEEGEAKGDSAKQFQSALGRAYEDNEDEDEVGGIDIERAKLLMREEDKFDKARFKELVKVRKEQKKEKRLAKEQKRKQQQEEEKGDKAGSGGDDQDDDDGPQEMDDFGSAEDSDGDGPDLSWLPDPDKIYGKGNSADEDEEEEQVFHRPPQKLVEKRKKNRNKRKQEEEEEEEEEIVVQKPAKKSKRQKPNLAEDLSLNEAEAIALKLLGS